jgi:DNA mismatch repair ATPase MutS
MKFTNKISLPFDVNLGKGRGKTPRFLDKIFGCKKTSETDSKKKESVEDVEESGLYLSVHGSITDITELEASVEEIKELFFERKSSSEDAVKKLLDGTYKKIADEASGVVTSFVTSLANNTSEAIPEVFENVEKGYHQFLITRRNLKNLDIEYSAEDLDDKYVVLGIQNRVRENLANGYTHVHDDMEAIASGKKAKYVPVSRDYARLYLQIEKEIIKEISEAEESEED